MEAFVIQTLKFIFKAVSLEMSVLKQVCSLGLMLDVWILQKWIQNWNSHILLLKGNSFIYSRNIYLILS